MIKSFVGPMFSGKSDSLISIYMKIWNKDLVLAFKPNKDSRDGAFIKSKNYDIKIPAIFIEDLSEIKEYIKKSGNIHTVFIDEAQMLEGNVSELVDLSVLYDIDFYIGGLNMTSEQQPFCLMPDILAVSDSVTNLTGFCQDCNRPSIYTYYTESDKTESVKVGDSGYVSLCSDCLRKRKLQKEKPKMLVRSKNDISY